MSLEQSLEQLVPGALSPQELSKVQEVRHRVKRNTDDDFVASDLLEASTIGGNTIEDMEKKRAGEAERNAHMLDVFRAELQEINKVIDATEANIARLEARMQSASGKWETAPPAAKGVYKKAIEQAKQEIYDLKTGPLYDGASLEQLKVGRNDIQMAITSLAAESDQPN